MSTTNNTVTVGNPNGGAQLIIDLTQTDLPLGTPVYIYIVGLVSTTYYYIDTNGNPQIMNTSDNTNAAGTFPGMSNLTQDAQNAISIGYPLAWADYSLQVEVGGNLVMNLGNINTSTISTLGTGTAAFSGRVYISVGVPKLPFTVQSSGYTAPVYGLGSGVTGSLCLYDWIEFSYDSEGNFNGNTTQVNQFGIPLMLTGTNNAGTTFPTQGTLNQSQTEILSTIAGNNSLFGGSSVVLPIPSAATVAYPLGISYLRAISPVTVSGAGTSLNTFFDADLATAYSAWQSTPLVTNDVSTGYYTGIVFPVSGSVITPPSDYPAGSLAFYEGNYATLEDLAVYANKPTTNVAFYLTGSSSNTVTSNDIWQCANSLATGSTAQGNVGKMIGAAFNRGVVVDAKGNVLTTLDDGTCASLSSSFYSSGTNFNHWSKWFHEFNTNGLAYGFPYDDVCSQNPSIPPAGDTLVAEFIRITMGRFFS